MIKRKEYDELIEHLLYYIDESADRIANSVNKEFIEEETIYNSSLIKIETILKELLKSTKE